MRFEDRPGGRGRPRRLWTLTSSGHARFPDRHGELAVQLIQQTTAALGSEAVQRLIAAREVDLQSRQESELSRFSTLESRLTCLAEMRTHDGFMASLQAQDEGWLLVQNHCPIRAAVATCPELCCSELNLVRSAAGGGARVEHVEHMPKGDHRCVYSIVPTGRN